MASGNGDAEPPATVTIDPRGDLLLIVGETKQPVLVSARVLQVACEVFRAMLGPNFKEGQELERHNVQNSGPYTLPLPDEEPEPMEVLCRVLHHSYHQLYEKAMSMDLLTSVAAVADKYDCASALYYPATVWLEAKLQLATTLGHESLLAIALQLDSPHVFRKISQNLILNWGGSYERLANKGNIDATVLCM
ncbi:hypothetical protein BLS_001681 [Venturia inaequalis]|uniref:BTB domain-containing protein n=1 Tax=Venturia inaequalis TaxID=5025 RepID=A0A8H3Z9U5_VENIN|nr:hypothetical protein BLS_001681 [Venturia inaequalis]